MASANAVWKTKGEQAKSGSDRGEIVIIAPNDFTKTGKPIITNGVIQGTVVNATDDAIATRGEVISVHVSPSAIKAIEKGVTEQGADTVALLRFKKDADGTYRSEFAAVVGEGRAMILPKKGPDGNYDKVVTPTAILVKSGTAWVPFNVANASQEDCDRLRQTLAQVKRGVEVPADANEMDRQKAKAAFPLMVMQSIYNVKAARLIDAPKGEDDQRDVAEIVNDSMQSLHDYTRANSNIRFAFRAFLSGPDGAASNEESDVLVVQPKWDDMKGYSLSHPGFADLAEAAEAKGMTVRVEAIPYTTSFASVFTDGTWTANAVAQAQEALEKATSNEDSAVYYRAMLRKAGVGPAGVLTTYITDKETGKRRIGVLLRTEKMSGGVPSLSHVVTPNFDGSKIKPAATHGAQQSPGTEKEKAAEHADSSPAPDAPQEPKDDVDLGFDDDMAPSL